MQRRHRRVARVDIVLRGETASRSLACRRRAKSISRFRRRQRFAEEPVSMRNRPGFVLDQPLLSPRADRIARHGSALRQRPGIDLRAPSSRSTGFAYAEYAVAHAISALECPECDLMSVGSVTIDIRTFAAAREHGLHHPARQRSLLLQAKAESDAPMHAGVSPSRRNSPRDSIELHQRHRYARGRDAQHVANSTAICIQLLPRRPVNRVQRAIH